MGLSPARRPPFIPCRGREPTKLFKGAKTANPVRSPTRALSGHRRPLFAVIASLNVSAVILSPGSTHPRCRMPWSRQEGRRTNDVEIATSFMPDYLVEDKSDLDVIDDHDSHHVGHSTRTQGLSRPEDNRCAWATIPRVVGRWRCRICYSPLPCSSTSTRPRTKKARTSNVWLAERTGMCLWAYP